jgi:hypothetical protein
MTPTPTHPFKPALFQILKSPHGLKRPIDAKQRRANSNATCTPCRTLAVERVQWDVAVGSGFLHVLAIGNVTRWW